MLDREVVKHTRDGLMKENLATGETELLTISDFGRETKYDNPEKDSQYGRQSSPDKDHHTESASSSRETRRKNTLGRDSSELSSFPDEIRSHMEPMQTYRVVGKAEQARSQAEKSSQVEHGSVAGTALMFTYGGATSGKQRSAGKNAEPKYYYSAKVDGGKIPTHADLREGVTSRRVFRAVKRVAEDTASNGENEDDNLGLQSAKSIHRTTKHIRSGIRTIKRFQQRGKTVFDTTERTVGKYGFGTAEKATQRAAVKGAQTAAKSVGKSVVKGVSSAAKNPVMIKVLLIVVIVILILLIIQVLCFSIGSVFGSVTASAHPDLDSFVQQLDDNFQHKIEALKDQYGKKSNTDVKIQGSDVINTDPNVLAILATGDWTNIDLTDENKARLTGCYNILVTYTITKTDEKISKKSGTGSESTSTKHHIVITIKVYNAKDKISAFGFTDAQRKNVLDMLDTLDEIEGSGIADGSVPTIPNAGSGSAPNASYSDPQVQALVTEANQYLGFPYVWGGSTPETSFDCSGFICWVFTHSGIHNLPRTTAQGLYDKCTPVSASEAKPGDLVFFTKTYPTSDTVTHVGIYVGNNRMIHCGDPIQYTTLEKAYWQQHLYSYGRLK